MKLKSFQSGGIIYTPFIPSRTADDSEPLKKGSSDKGAKTDIKDTIMSLVKENGLPNDVNYALQEIETILKKYQGLGDNVDYDPHDLTRVASLVNQIKMSKAEYEKASTKLDSEGAWSDVAINSAGNLYAVDKETKEQITITPAEYHNNKDKYQLLNYSQLMDYRQNSPDVIYNNVILSDGRNAVGMNTIVNHLHAAISKFGKEEIENYSAETFKSIENGISKIRGGMFKVKSSTQIKNDEDLMSACAYLFQSLNNTEKNKLVAECAARGGDPNSDADVLSFIAQAVIRNTSRSYSKAYDNTMSEAAYGSKKSSGSGDRDVTGTQEMSYTEKMATGVGVRDMDELYDLTPEGSRAHMLVHGKTYTRALATNEKDALGIVSFDEVMKNAAGIPQIAAQQAVIFGDRVIDANNTNALMYDNTNMVRVEMPYTYDSKGRIIPDFAAQKKAEEFEKYMQGHKGMREVDIQKWLDKNIPNATWDAENKQLKFNQTTAFMVMGAIASSECLRDQNLAGSQYLTNMSTDEAKQWKDRYNTVLMYGTDNPGKQDKEKTSYNKWKSMINWRLNNDTFYRGNVFIPINPNLVYNRELLMKSDYLYGAEQADQKDRRQHTRTNFSE